MISYLHYLTASKPDIYLNIYMCALLQSDSIETLLTYGKRILRYLKGNTNPDLMYKKTSEYKLSGLYDATRDRIRRKCTSGNYLL